MEPSGGGTDKAHDCNWWCNSYLDSKQRLVIIVTGDVRVILTGDITITVIIIMGDVRVILTDDDSSYCYNG